MKKKVCALLILCLTFGLYLAPDAFGKIRIKAVGFELTEKREGLVRIKIKGRLKEIPKVTINDRIIQVVIPESIVWPKIEKKVTLGARQFDTTLMAYQYNKELVRVRAIVPYSLAGYEGKIKALMVGNDLVYRIPAKDALKAPSGSIGKKIRNVNQYDEKYLEELLSDKEKSNVKEIISKDISPDKKGDFKEDKVGMKMSSTEGPPDNQSKIFSMGKYIGKFALFLVVVLVLFYLVVGIFRKSFLKKGRLGFLNDTNLVTVLNTTYLAPKKSLLMVKVHKQVLLLGSDERGIHFVSEISDTTGLLKDGEKKLAGNNFDTSLNDADKTGKEFKLKELELPTVDGEEQVKKDTEVKDKVKLSDQIKNKVKGLRPLQ